MYNTKILEKMPQSIRKNLEKHDFSDIFPILDIFKKSKKTSKWTEKNEHQHFFSCFYPIESMHGLVFF
jgi:hypothetical protein